MNITIGRLPEDPSVHMVIQPEDKRWQLLIDNEGYPHLYIEVQIEAEGNEPAYKGLFCIEDMLPDDATIPDIMKGSFLGRLSPEEEEKAADAFHRSREETKIPCPIVKGWSR